MNQGTHDDDSKARTAAAAPGNALPRVSVIIPVFNDAAGIGKCLDALGRQSYPGTLVEVIVVDNGSEPPMRLAQGHSDGARLIACESPGSYSARNAGITSAQGDVLAFTDADCIPDRDWLTKGIAELRVHDGRCVIGGEVRLRPSPRPSAVELYQAISGFMQRENVRDRGFTATANLFVTRAAMEQIGPFDTTLLSGGDREWSWRAADSGYPVVYAADAVVVTPPRRSLRAAARQVRRVAGGRAGLRRDGGTGRSEHVKPHRGPLKSVQWILRHPDLGAWNRVRVLVVAVILYLVRLLERARLSLGFSPERR